MSRRRIAVALVLAAIVAAVVVWQRGDERSSSSATKLAADQAKRTREAKAAGAHPMAYFAQRNVGARRIAGIVEQDGAPVEGATVRLGSEATQAGAIAEPIVVTGADGRFDFGPQLAMRLSVIAEKPKRTAAVAWVDLRDPKLAADDLHLTMHACDASIHGTIRDAAGGVVPHARVAAMLAGWRSSGGAEADDQGTYELCVPVGWTTVIASADGYAQTVDTLEAYGAVRRDFALVPGATVVGRVVRARDRAPVAGARVELRPEPLPGSGMTRTTALFAMSDDNGAFQLEDVMPGPYQVSAVADGFASARPAYVFAETGEAPDEVVCVVTETTTIAGKVIEHGTKKPVAGASVWMRRATERDGADPTAITQADGSFVADNVLPGEYTPAMYQYELKPTSNVTVAAAPITGIVLEVEQLGSIAGRITHAGKPVDGADVTLRGPTSISVRSDRMGRYELRGVTPGLYQVYVQSNRIGAFSPGANFTLGKGEHRTGVDIELNLAGSVAGVVVDQSDAPVPGVVVKFSLLGGEDYGFATTAEDGSFKATALSGGGDYVYEVQPSQSSSLVHPPAIGKRHPPIAVRDGATHVTGLRIKIRREQLAIAGRVLDATGKPIAGARIRFEPALYEGQPTMTDDTGAFSIRGLPAGTYNLSANVGARAAYVANIAAGRTDVVIKLVETGAIEGTLEGFTDEPDIVASTGGAVYRGTSTSSTFRVRNLPKGSYRVRAASATGIADGTATVEPGAVAKLVLRRRGYGTIAGTIIDAARQLPLANVHCEAIVEGADVDGSAPMTRTDARGRFKLERVPAGPAEVYCIRAHATVTVVAGETVRIDLVAKDRPPSKRPRGYVGMELEEQLGEIRVKSVVTGGPAARAGVVAGDIVVKVDGEPIQFTVPLEAYEVGATVEIVVERDDKETALQLKIEAAPP